MVTWCLYWLGGQRLVVILTYYNILTINHYISLWILCSLFKALKKLNRSTAPSIWIYGVVKKCGHTWGSYGRGYCKAGCLFEVFSSVSGRFGDPYSTKGPSSSVFDGQSRTKRLPGDLSRNPLVTLGLRSLSLWRGVHFDSQRLRRSCAEILTRGSFIERLEILPRRPLIEILYREPS